MIKVRCINLCIIAFILHPCLVMNSNVPWWKQTIIYEVWLRSFKDSNGDGTGDINGVIEKLDHFVDLKIETLWLSPFTKSPLKDLGYDVSNYMDIEPLFGTMADFRNLMKELKKRNMKLIFDLPINHTSDQHEWFRKSINMEEPYTKYYVWKNPKGYDEFGRPIPPNNWTSIFGGKSAWTWNEKRNQFYYHAFGSCQPDLNFRSANVIHEMKRILKFWIERGVSGFRIDAAPFIMEDKFFRDETTDEGREMTLNHPDTFRLINKLRTFVDAVYNENASPNNEIVLVVEAVQSYKYIVGYYGKEGFPVAHYPFNFDFLLFPPISEDHYPIELDAEYLEFHVKKWLNGIPAGAVVNWVSETHDLPRISERVSPQFRDMFVILTMLLPGSVSIYYGQEIGMTGMEISDNEKVDRFNNRDGCRTPMQWNKTDQAGFSSNPKTWLPINPNYKDLNVETQKQQKHSRYKMFKALSTLRQTTTIKYGKFDSYKPHPHVLVFTRKLENHEMYIVFLNLSSNTVVFNLKQTLKYAPRNMKIITTSVNLMKDPGTMLPTENCNINLSPYSSVVLVADCPYLPIKPAKTPPFPVTPFLSTGKKPPINVLAAPGTRWRPSITQNHRRNDIKYPPVSTTMVNTRIVAHFPSSATTKRLANYPTKPRPVRIPVHRVPAQTARMSNFNMRPF